MKTYTVVGVHSATKSQDIQADDYSSAIDQADDVYSVSQCWHCAQDHEIDGDVSILVYDNEGVEVYNDSMVEHQSEEVTSIKANAVRTFVSQYEYNNTHPELCIRRIGERYADNIEASNK